MFVVFTVITSYSIHYTKLYEVFTVILGLVSLLLFGTKFGEQKQSKKQLKITIPENLDYMGLFDDLFSQYTKSSSLIRVKTTNMGSLFQLSFEIELKDNNSEKEFLDKIRIRNGNLDIICGYINDASEVL